MNRDFGPKKKTTPPPPPLAFKKGLELVYPEKLFLGPAVGNWVKLFLKYPKKKLCGLFGALFFFWGLFFQSQKGGQSKWGKRWEKKKKKGFSPPESSRFKDLFGGGKKNRFGKGFHQSLEKKTPY